MDAADALRAALRAGDDVRASRGRPGPRRCAVVGSGQDLICYQPHRGREIDEHDVVWRANAAQHYHVDNGSTVGELMRGAGASRRGWRMMQLLRYRGPEYRAGTRTDYRTNCLFDGYVVSRSEACVVSRAWFKQGGRALRTRTARAAIGTACEATTGRPPCTI